MEGEKTIKSELQELRY